MNDAFEELLEMFRESPWLSIAALILLVLAVGAFDDPLSYTLR